MKNKIRTKDFYLAAALLALGSKLDEVDKTDSRHMEFTIISERKFESENIPVADLESYEKQWANKTLEINAYEFKEAIQRMKSVIHST